MVLHTLYSAKPGVFACVSDFCEPLTRKPFGTSAACASESLRTLGRFAAQNFLSGLHFSPEQALGYSATLWVSRGRSSGLRPALRAPLRGLAGGSLMSPSQGWLTPPTTPPSTGKPVAVGPLEWSAFESPLPAHSVCWSAGFAPTMALGRQSASLPACVRVHRGSPTSSSLDPGLTPPLSRLRADPSLRFEIVAAARENGSPAGAVRPATALRSYGDFTRSVCAACSRRRASTLRKTHPQPIRERKKGPGYHARAKRGLTEETR